MSHIIVKIADEKDRVKIYKIRHDIYAKELHQHEENSDKLLSDEMDNFNTYIVVEIDGNISGFVSITPPYGKYGLDKYISRDKYPFIYDNMYEGRLFTVLPEYRSGCTALVLFFACFRFAEYNGGDKIMTIGRFDLVDFYKKTGLIDLDETIHSGAVNFKLMYSKISDLRNNCRHLENILKRYLPNVENRLPFSILKENKCYHGGHFFNAIGNDFSTLEKSKDIINADVLDAWFDPSPKVIEALKEYLPWIIKTSPPTHSEGLIKTISQNREISINNILTGGGSSDLMYLALPNLLKKNAKVLLLNPTYGEYDFIFRNVIDAQIDKFNLFKQDDYQINFERLIQAFSKKKYDIFVIVNPNSPTGQYLKPELIIEILKIIPKTTYVWIDETYIEYIGSSNSLEKLCENSDNIIVCKSMSKVYALSGVRCAYLVSNSRIIEQLKLYSPPWAVSLPAQIAGVNALKDPDYYNKCYLQTLENKQQLINQLKKIKEINIIQGHINSILCEFPSNIDINKIIKDCITQNLFIRNVSNMGDNWNENILRIAIKDKQTNDKIAQILQGVYEIINTKS
jgi:histidinol-phosphate/aromatic aminotransferase/cobyric acid decarboxylase-like protein